MGDAEGREGEGADVFVDVERRVSVQWVEMCIARLWVVSGF